MKFTSQLHVFSFYYQQHVKHRNKRREVGGHQTPFALKKKKGMTETKSLYSTIFESGTDGLRYLSTELLAEY